MEQGFTHFNKQGEAVMVDVGGKTVTDRRATAVGRIAMSGECFAAVKAGTAKKGDVLGVARVAGIMAVKRTADLIPLCHPLPLTGVAVDFTLHDDACEIEARCTATTTGQTGVEMEALTGATVALLTIYDMCKAVDRGMVLRQVYLDEKSGGKSGHFRHGEDAPHA